MGACLDLAELRRQLLPELAQAQRQLLLGRARLTTAILGHQPPTKREELVGPRPWARQAIPEVAEGEAHARKHTPSNDSFSLALRTQGVATLASYGLEGIHAPVKVGARTRSSPWRGRSWR